MSSISNPCGASLAAALSVVLLLSPARAQTGGAIATTVAVATGDAAYGPTTNDGDTFLHVGVPAINDSGDIAFSATIAGGKGRRYAVATTAGNKAVRTLAGSARVLAAAGDAAPGTTGKFRNFRAPLLDDSGMVVFGAWTGRGPGKEDFGVWATNEGIQPPNIGEAPGLSLTLVARENQDVPNLPRTRINDFVQIAVENTVVSMLVNLRGAKNGGAVLIWSPWTGLQVILKEGDLVDGKTIKSIRTLGAVAGSTGHGRSFNGASGAGLLSFTDGTTALARYTLAGGVQLDVASDAPFTFQNATGLVTDAAWKTLSVPCLTSGASLSAPMLLPFPTLDTLTFLGNLKGGPGGVTAGHTLGVFVHDTEDTKVPAFVPTPNVDNTEIINVPAMAAAQALVATQNVAVLQVGDPVPLRIKALNGAFTYKSFRDPVAATQDGGIVGIAAQGAIGSSATWVAGVARIAGEGVKNSDDEVLYVSPAFPSSSYIVARENDLAPESDDARFLRFESVALPAWFGAGPLFVARLKASTKINARNDLGLWAAELEGPVRLALREGDAVEVRGVTRTVYNLNVLGVVPASSGQTRAFNRNRQVAVQVTFTDFTEAVLILEIAAPVPN